MEVLGILLLILASLSIGAIVFLIILNPWFTVREKQAVIIERLGQFNRVVGPGMHFIWPFIEQKGKFRQDGELLDYLEQKDLTVELSAQSVITKDNIQLGVDSVAYYHISDPQKAVYGVDDVIVAFNQLIKTVLRNVIAETTLQELLSGREEINERLREQVAKASEDWGISIRSVELQSVNPPQTYLEAMQRVSEAELAKQATITEAEGKKQAMILEGEGDAERLKRLIAASPIDDWLKIQYLKALEKIADGKATKLILPFPQDPTNKNASQQTFGRAAGNDLLRQVFGMVTAVDAYKTLSEPDKQELEQSSEILGEQKPSNAQPDEPPRKKVIRRIVRKPASQDVKKPPDSEKT